MRSYGSIETSEQPKIAPCQCDGWRSATMMALSGILIFLGEIFFLLTTQEQVMDRVITKFHTNQKLDWHLSSNPRRAICVFFKNSKSTLERINIKGKAMLRGKATQTLRSENIENVVWYDFLLNIEVGLPHSLQQDGSVSGMGRPAIEL